MTPLSDNSPLSHDLPENFSALFEGTEQALLGRQMRAGLPLGIFVFLSFLLLDWIIVPELFLTFAVVRVIAVTVPIAIIPISKTAFGERHVRGLTLLTFLVGSAALTTMCYFMGGFDNNYFFGLILLMFFVGLFLPWGIYNNLLFLFVSNFGYFTASYLKNNSFDHAAAPIAFMLGTAVLTHFAAITVRRARSRDFAMRFQLEQANDDLQELDKAKSRFFSNINHELRTPLTLILAPLESMMRGDKVDQAKMLKSMNANANRLLRQVNALLDLAKLDSSKLECRRELYSLTDIVDGLVTSAQPSAEQQGICLEHEGVADLPRFPIDPDQIETVIMNLISNALKFSGPDSRVLLQGGIAGDNISLTVSDQGRGMEAEQLPYIFDRFHQTPEKAGNKTKGTGLGLSLVKDLVELHGGSINVESELEVGTTFTILLPNAETSDWDPLEESASSVKKDKPAFNIGDAVAPTPEPDEVAPELAAPADAPRILIVEDNADMRNFIASSLSQTYNILLAENGEDGLRVARQEHPDIIISDVQMPIMDGFEMLSELRQDKSFNRTPILMLTAQANSSAMVESLKLGAVDYIHKPFKLAEVEARIATHLRTIATLEELDERNSRLVAVGQIASTLAHDMRGPLTAIVNRAELLRIIAGGGEQSEIVEQELSAIEQAVRRVNSMIQELLEFVSGREVLLEQSIVTVEELLVPIASESGVALKHSGIDWSFTMQDGDKSLLVDHQRFARIIENIVNNARDALLGEKTVEPKVSMHASTGDGNLILRISDNGPGIPEEIADSLFQAYATAGKAQGSGLGLAIVSNLILANGGSVAIDNTVKEGASFVISLPLL
jgi:signal transduction histidine kinase